MRARRPRQLIRCALRPALLMALSLLFSGCIGVEFSSRFEREGAAIHSMQVVIPRDEYDASVTDEHLELWEEIAATASEAGLEPQRTESRESVVFRVSIERPDASDASAALNSLLNVTGLNPSPGVIAPFQGIYEQQGAAVGGSEFVLDMSVDGGQLLEALTALEAADDLDPAALDEVRITYAADLPGELQSSTADRTTNDGAIWVVPHQGTIELDAEASAGRPEKTFLFIVAAAVSLAIVLLAGLVMGWMLARRPALASGIGSAAGHFPRRTTITDEGLWVAHRVRQLVERIWHRSAPHGDPPVQHALLESVAEPERDEDGPDAEGNRPPAGVRGG